MAQEGVNGLYQKINQQIGQLAGIYHHAASRAGLSDNELWVWYTLLVLDENCTQQDICRIWSLPKQTVNSIIAHLLAKNLIRLQAVPGTRNRKIIIPTPQGRQYGQARIQPICQAEQRALRGFCAQEQQACVLLLDKYIALLKRAFSESETACEAPDPNPSSSNAMQAPCAIQTRRQPQHSEYQKEPNEK